MASDDEDLTVCIICQEDFDCQNNLPKLLSCHHCICLSCIKVKRINQKLLILFLN